MKKMTKKQMYLYGLPGLATLFTFTMFTTYGLYFFTDVVDFQEVLQVLL